MYFETVFSLVFYCLHFLDQNKIVESRETEANNCMCMIIIAGLYSASLSTCAVCGFFFVIALLVGRQVKLLGDGCSLLVSPVVFPISCPYT